MLKYFTSEDFLTVDAVKKKYKKLAFQYHPDLRTGASEAEKKEGEDIMKIINDEYQRALQMVGKQTQKQYSQDTQYPIIIDELIKMQMQHVDIEICGWFVYLSGNTKPYKEQLKKLKFLWNNKKAVWYWKPNWWKKSNVAEWDMKKIRDVYGSEYVRKSNAQQPKGRVALLS